MNHSDDLTVSLHTPKSMYFLTLGLYRNCKWPMKTMSFHAGFIRMMSLQCIDAILSQIMSHAPANQLTHCLIGNLNETLEK